jgi:Arylsulfatase regulator (Fe-S oxidoreductase)
MNYTIDLMLTHSCNLRCTYCYESGCSYEPIRTSKEVLDKSIERIIEFKQLLGAAHTISIVFWGGEPTLEYKSMDYIMSKLHGYVKSFFTSSNGYEIDKLIPYIKKWRKYNFQFQVSYDFEPIQSLNRLNIKGQSSNTQVLKNIKTLAENDILFSLKATIKPSQITYIEQIYFNYCQLRKELRTINPALDVNLRLNFVTDAPFPQFSTETLQTFRNQLTTILTDIVTNNTKHNFNWFAHNRQFCTAGDNSLCIDCDGIVYLCHGCIFSPTKNQHVRGDIFNNSIKSMMGLNCTYKQPSACDKCSTLVCYKCPIHNYDKSNKVRYSSKLTDYACDKNACLIQQEISKFTYALIKIQRKKYGMYESGNRT